MWEISVSGQVISCLYSFALGGALCVFYDLIRATRSAGANSAFAVFAGDVIFSAVSAVCVFLFAVALTNGEIRGYIVFSVAAGFLAFRFTLGRITFFVFDLFFCFFGKVAARIFAIAADVCDYLQGVMSAALGKTAGAAASCACALKKLLKSVCKMLYTTKYKRKAKKVKNEQRR
jgi:hypothetical protein